MACPFSPDFVGPDSGEKSKQDKIKTPRQSSIQITSSLLGEDEEPEDTQTLNLKHLRAAVLMLTNPTVRKNIF